MRPASCFRVPQRHGPPRKVARRAVGESAGAGVQLTGRRLLADAAVAALREIVLQPARFDRAPFDEVVDEIREADAERDQAEEHRHVVVAVADERADHDREADEEPHQPRQQRRAAALRHAAAVDQLDRQRRNFHAALDRRHALGVVQLHQLAALAVVQREPHDQDRQPARRCRTGCRTIGMSSSTMCSLACARTLTRIVGSDAAPRLQGCTDVARSANCGLSRPTAARARVTLARVSPH